MNHQAVVCFKRRESQGVKDRYQLIREFVVDLNFCYALCSINYCQRDNSILCLDTVGWAFERIFGL